MDAAKNFAKGTLSTGYDDEATSIVLIGGDGARFPTVPFNAVWWNATDYPDPADDPDREIVRVTARSTDTLTVTRAQEGTAASTKNFEGKVYRLAAGFTAIWINERMLEVARSGDAYTVLGGDGLHMHVLPNQLAVRLQATNVSMGDIDGNSSGTMLKVDDDLAQISLTGKIGTDQKAAASAAGTLNGKVEIFDLAGNSIGFLPVYASIT